MQEEGNDDDKKGNLPSIIEEETDDTPKRNKPNKGYKSSSDDPKLFETTEADDKTKWVPKDITNSNKQDKGDENLENGGSSIKKKDDLQPSNVESEDINDKKEEIKNFNDQIERSEESENANSQHIEPKTYFDQSINKWLASDVLKELINKLENTKSIENNDHNLNEIIGKLCPMLKNWNKRRCVGSLIEQLNDQFCSVMNLFSKDYYTLKLDAATEGFANDKENDSNRLISVNQELVAFIQRKDFNLDSFVNDRTTLQKNFNSKYVSWIIRYMSFLKNRKFETEKDINKVFKDLLILLCIKGFI